MVVAECSHSLVSWLLYSHLYLDEAVSLESREPIRLTETDDPPLGECLLQPLSEISKIGPLVYPHLREPCCVRMHSCLWLCVAIYVSISLECNYQQMDGMFMLAI